MSDQTYLYISLVANLIFAILAFAKSVKSCHTWCFSYTTTNGDIDLDSGPKTTRFQSIIQKITPRISPKPSDQNQNAV